MKANLLALLLSVTVVSLLGVVHFLVYSITSGTVVVYVDQQWWGGAETARETIADGALPESGQVHVHLPNSSAAGNGVSDSKVPPASAIRKLQMSSETFRSSGPEKTNSSPYLVMNTKPSQSDKPANHSINPWPPNNAPDWLTDTCEDKLCIKYLSPADSNHFRRMTLITKSPPGPNPRCHFMNGTGRDLVGLVSVPGSGNTWTRGLLERATGICTGSIYTDKPLRLGGFLGEYVQGGSVLVVKSHTSDFQWKGEKLENKNVEDALYGSAIVLVRSPFDTFVSERNRVVSIQQRIGYGPKTTSRIDVSHTKLVDKSNFGDDPKWDTFIQQIGERWVKTLKKWVLHPTSRMKKVMILRFEDVKRDKVSEVKKMLRFMDFPFDEKVVEERLEGDYNMFRRNHTEKFEHFTVEQKKWVNNMLLEMIAVLQKNGLEDEFRLQEYIAEL